MAQLMDLVRELKALNQKKRGGELLTAVEEARRQELRAYLATQIPTGPVDSQEAPVPQVAAPKAVPLTATTTPTAFVQPAMPPAPTPPPAPKPASAYANAYALDANALFATAMASDAVKALDPYARKASASGAELDDVARRADAAAAANRHKSNTRPDDVATELQSQSWGYEPDLGALSMSEYFSDAADQGLAVASGRESAQLLPIDPREAEFKRVTDRLGAGVPPGLEFLDDFPLLYRQRIIAAPLATAPTAASDPDLLIARRKVTIHLLSGATKQGQVRAYRRGDVSFRLEGAAPEDIQIDRCKAIFVHTPGGGTPTYAAARPITVTFLDGRSIQGTTDSLEPGALTLLYPPPGRGNVELVIIQPGAIKAAQ
jgi:hypothetical protein